MKSGLLLKFMLALVAIAVMFGLVLPWLVSAKSTIAVLVAAIMLFLFVYMATLSILNAAFPKEKEPK